MLHPLEHRFANKTPRPVQDLTIDRFYLTAEMFYNVTILGTKSTHARQSRYLEPKPLLSNLQRTNI